jgi:hypothetical protein
MGATATFWHSASSRSRRLARPWRDLRAVVVGGGSAGLHRVVPVLDLHLAFLTGGPAGSTPSTFAETTPNGRRSRVREWSLRSLSGLLRTRSWPRNAASAQPHHGYAARSERRSRARTDTSRASIARFACSRTRPTPRRRSGSSAPSSERPAGSMAFRLLRQFARRVAGALSLGRRPVLHAGASPQAGCAKRLAVIASSRVGLERGADPLKRRLRPRRRAVAAQDGSSRARVT